MERAMISLSWSELIQEPEDETTEEDVISV